ncbi:MAG TPA: hypothetical protein VIM12_05685 [Noviherbaspirillum sp.]|uniref:hypothetical protein n=1 Tax=Noviherbaspirillum sp. TaxID=1926288 RepID=UPI002F9475E8
MQSNNYFSLNQELTARTRSGIIRVQVLYPNRTICFRAQKNGKNSSRWPQFLKHEKYRLKTMLKRLAIGEPRQVASLARAAVRHGFAGAELSGQRFEFGFDEALALFASCNSHCRIRSGSHRFLKVQIWNVWAQGARLHQGRSLATLPDTARHARPGRGVTACAEGTWRCRHLRDDATMIFLSGEKCKKPSSKTGLFV